MSDNPETREAAVERACEVMHDAYEAAAVGAGWETQAASRKPWADVPAANKATMRAAVSALLGHLAALPPVAGPEVRPDETLRAAYRAMDEAYTELLDDLSAEGRRARIVLRDGKEAAERALASPAPTDQEGGR